MWSAAVRDRPRQILRQSWEHEKPISWEHEKHCVLRFLGLKKFRPAAGGNFWGFDDVLCRKCLQIALRNVFLIQKRIQNAKNFRLRRPYYNRIPLSKCSKTQILALGEKAAQARKKGSRHKRKKRFSAACGGKKERRISLVPCEFMYINHNWRLLFDKKAGGF